MYRDCEISLPKYLHFFCVVYLKGNVQRALFVSLLEAGYLIKFSSANIFKFYEFSEILKLVYLKLSVKYGVRVVI